MTSFQQFNRTGVPSGQNNEVDLIKIFFSIEASVLDFRIT